MYGIMVKQKKALKKAVRRYCDTTGRYPSKATDLDEFDAIGDMNPCEIYWSCAMNYVDDLRNDPDFKYMWEYRDGRIG